MTIEDVAKVTKIQPRILEKLESGQLDGLPAAVFVKGFVRSFAKCVGLDESEALDRYSAAQAQAGQPQLVVAKALVETMARTMASAMASDEAAGKRGRRASTAPTAPGERGIEARGSVVDIRASASTPAPVEVAPAAQRQEARSPVDTTPVAETASATPSVETAPATPTASATATVAADTASTDTSAQPALAAENASTATSAQPVAAAMQASTQRASEAPRKKRSRKKNQNAQQRARKKKLAQQAQLAAAEASTAASTIERSIDTAPVAKIDGESPEATSIEAKTSDAIAAGPTVDVVIEDGVVTTPSLAEGSQRMKAAVVDASADASSTPTSAQPPHEVGAAGDATAATAETTIDAKAEVTIDATSAVERDADASATASDADAPAPESAAEPTGGTWQPTMPPLGAMPSVPWRRPSLPASPAYVVPTLVIDDADPESADREREQRAAKEPNRLSFLPPILLDRDDRSARQGGLTLAVIILLIAATLTLSYLMRRPSPSGDGVTMLDARSLIA